MKEQNQNKITEEDFEDYKNQIQESIIKICKKNGIEVFFDKIKVC